MNLQRFVRWCETAPSRQRADGYAILARSLEDAACSASERAAITDGLHLVLDDPSPKVRMVVADAVATSVATPRALVKALLLDIDAIAIRIAASPALTNEDLRDALAVVREPVRAAIAVRPQLGSVAIAIARLGGIAACTALAANEGTVLPAKACRRLVERWGHDPALRSLLLERRDLPADVRQTLILEAAYSLQHSAFVAGVLGSDRAGAVAFDACARATAAMTEEMDAADVPALIDHLRTSGQLTPAFLIRIACSGHIDVLAAALTALSGLSDRRVRAIVVEARKRTFLSLAMGCGLDEGSATLLHLATRQWKEIAAAAAAGDVEEMAARVTGRVAAACRRMRPGFSADASRFLRQLEGEAARDAARSRRHLLLAA